MSDMSFLLQFHVAISLVGIVAGFVAVGGLVAGRVLPGWTLLFLATTIVTDVTGYPLPPFGFDPPRIIGTLSLALLALSVIALYAFHLAGRWRLIYIVTACAGLFLNAFVAVVQSFQKVPAFHALAPNGTEVPFAATVVALLVTVVILGFSAAARFRTA
jgi:hypothetical protein